MYYKTFIYKIFPYIRSYFKKLALATLIIILAVLLESFIPEMTGRIVDDLFVNNSNKQTAALYAGILVLIFVIKTIFTLASVAINSWVSNQVMMDLRSDMFAKLLKLPKSYFDQYSTGKILSKLAYEVGQISNVTASIWVNFIKSLMLIIFLIGYLFYKSWELSLVLVVFLPLVFLVIKISSNRIRSASRRVQESMGSMTHLLGENILGNSLVKIYNAQTQEESKFFSLNKDIRQRRFKVDMTESFNLIFIKILTGIMLSSVVYFASINLIMSAGDFIAYFSALAMLSKPVKIFININKSLQVAMAAAESVFGLIDEDEECNNGTQKITKSKGIIEFKDVFFGYSSDTVILKKINLNIKSGETIALVGSSGSGKTTIIQLLAKFYSPTSGVITLDGTDISKLEVDSLRSQISFVDQNVRLFNDTIKDNIALGQINIMSDAKIQNAAKVSGSYGFIQELDNKFDTEIGENGTKLSGGQRQRLAIARAIAKDSPILILDEATSALDSFTESQVQTAIEKMQKGRTTIIIAHRLSTIQKADRIVVLSHGEIIEQGSHQELIDAKGEYALLYKHQFN